MAGIENEQDVLLRKRARRRLVGSIVLVIIAIVVLPMVLEHTPKQEGASIEIIIPSENLRNKFSASVNPEVGTSETEVPVSTYSTPGTTSLSSENDDSKEARLEVEQITEKKSDLSIKESQGKKEQEVGKVAGSGGGLESIRIDKKLTVAAEEFVVQLGAFSDSTKAKHQQQSLASNGIKKAYTEMIKNNNTQVTRVRVGPFFTREEAEKEQKKLRKLGINGVVMSK